MTLDIFSFKTLNNGVHIPAYGYGVYKLNGQELVNALTCAISVGYRLIDTASYYENEAGVGDFIKTGKIPREQLFLVTKLWPTEYRDPAAALARSLKRLQTDYLDAYLLHWPGLDESLRLATYEKLLVEREKGRIRVLGVSNFLQNHLEQIYDNFREWPAIDEIEVHPQFQQKELRSFCGDKKIQALSWAPLGRGGDMELAPIREIASETGHTPAQVILRWQVQSGLAPLPKSARDYRIRENAEIFDFELDASQMSRIAALDVPGNAHRIGRDPDSWPPMA